MRTDIVSNLCNQLIVSLHQWGQGQCVSSKIESAFRDLIGYLETQVPFIEKNKVQFDSNVVKLGDYLACIIDEDADENQVDDAIDGFYTTLANTLELFPNSPSANAQVGQFGTSDEIAEIIAAKVVQKLQETNAKSTKTISQTTLVGDNGPEVAELEAKLKAKDIEIKQWQQRHQDLHKRCDALKRQLHASSKDNFEDLEFGDDLEDNIELATRWCQEACDTDGALDAAFREGAGDILEMLLPKLKEELGWIWQQISKYREDILESQSRNANVSLPSTSSLKLLETRMQTIRKNSDNFSVLFSDLIKPRLKCIWEDSLRQVVREQNAVQTAEAFFQNVTNTLTSSDNAMETLNQIRSLADKKQIAALLNQLKEATLNVDKQGLQSIKTNLNQEIQTAASNASPDARTLALEQLDHSLDKKRSKKIVAPMPLNRFSDTVPLKTSPEDLLSNSANIQSNIIALIRQQHRQNPRNWRKNRLNAIEELEKNREAVFDSFKQKIESL